MNRSLIRATRLTTCPHPNAISFSFVRHIGQDFIKAEQKILVKAYQTYIINQKITNPLGQTY